MKRRERINKIMNKARVNVRRVLNLLMFTLLTLLMACDTPSNTTSGGVVKSDNNFNLEMVYAGNIGKPIIYKATIDSIQYIILDRGDGVAIIKHKDLRYGKE